MQKKGKNHVEQMSNIPPSIRHMIIMRRIIWKNSMSDWLVEGNIKNLSISERFFRICFWVSLSQDPDR